jgi:hypothetical protein
MDAQVTPKGDIMTRTSKLIVAGILVLTLAGCQAHRMRSQDACPGPVVAPPQPAPVFMPPPGCPPGAPPGSVPPGAASGALLPPGGSTLPPGASTLPPGAIAAPRPPVNPAPPQGPGAFPTAPPSTASPPTTSSLPPPPQPPSSGLDRVGYRSEPLVPPANPANPSTSPQSPSVFLLPPTNDTAEPPTASPKVALYPPTPDNTPRPSPFPVGILNFDRLNANVATGGRPTLEGLDWLKKDGFAVVVFAHLPGVKVDPDREQVTKRGMKFIDIEFDPRSLSKESVDAYLKVQRDAATAKAFVYDDVDGAVTGAMWYLSFRLLENATDEVARVRAGSLGLRENREGTHREMWQGVRNYVEMR